MSEAIIGATLFRTNAGCQAKLAGNIRGSGNPKDWTVAREICRLRQSRCRRNRASAVCCPRVG